MKKLGKIGLFTAALTLGLWLSALGAGAETVSLTLDGPETPYAGESGDLPGNDALFDAYFDSLSFGEPITPLDTQGALLPNVQMQRIYTFLRSSGEAVAAGSTTSTAFSAGAEVMDASISYTVGTTASSDIRLSIPVYYNGSFTQANGSATMPGSTQLVGDYFVSQITGQALHLPDIVHGHLLGDCPATFYWYDKSIGYDASVGLHLTMGAGGLITDVSLTSLTVKFKVATDYRAVPDDKFTVSTAKISAARTAIANAKAIVASHAAESDYQKLISYKNEICDRVYYDHVTLANQEAGLEVGTNTWQLVYAFDNDPTTNIVCEGYAKAFQYLCDLSTFRYPVQCYSVTGVMAGGTGAGGHMWNVVRMGWKTYMVDVTNCDDAAPGYGRPVGYPDRLFMLGGSPAASNRDKYTWTAGGSTLNYTYYNGTEGGTRDQRWLYGDLLTLDTANYSQPTAAQPNWYWYADDQNRFVLSTPSELAGFLAMLRTGSRTFLNKTVVLANDIDLSTITFPSFAGKTPALFNGVLDGQGHTVTGLAQLDHVLLQGVQGGTVKNLIADGILSDSNLDDAIVTDCLSLGYPVVRNNAKSTAKVTNCASTGSAVVTSNAGTVSNCYYRSDADDDGISNTYPMTAAQFASGEVAWSLQNSRTALAWGQDIGVDALPIPTAVAAKRVRQVTFLLENNAPAYATVFVNHGKTAPLPAEPTATGYAFQRWALSRSLDAAAFSAGDAVTKDMAVYAVMRALFGEESGGHVYTAPYRQAVNVELTELVGYVDPALTESNLTFAVESFSKDGAAADSGWLTLSGSALTLKAGAPAGEYAVSVRVSEQAPSYALFSIDQYGSEDITLQLTLTVTPIPATVAAIAQTVPYGQGIQTGADGARFSAAGTGDVLAAVTLVPSSLDVPGGAINPSAARIVNPDGLDVTASYTLTYVAGQLTVEKVPFPAPAAPELGALSADAVTLTAPAALADGEALPAGAALEYSADGESWQTGLVFDGLDPNRAYTFRARLAGDANHLPSDGSGPLACTTPKAPLAEASVALDLPGGGYVYDGTEKTPAVTVTWKGRTVPADQYTVAYGQNTDAGDAAVTLTGQNDYTGAAEASFPIARRPLAGGEVRFALPEGGLVYTGAEQTPDLTLLLDGQAVSADQYTVAYEQNKDAGDAAVTLTGQKNHTGTLAAGFVIAPRPIRGGEVRFALPEGGCVYNGTAKTPAVTLTLDGQAVDAGEYTVAYAQNTGAGDAAVTLTGQKNHTGTLNAGFAIAPATVTVQPGTCKVSKTYDGGVGAGQLSGAPAVSGILPADSAVTVAVIHGDYASPDVGGQTTLNAALTLSGPGSENYALAAGTLSVPCDIRAKSSILTAGSQRIVYGQSVAQGPDQVQIFGLVSGHKLSAVTLTAGSLRCPGGSITPSAAVILDAAGRDVTANYSVRYNGGGLVVDKRPLTVTAADKTAYRGHPLPPLTATADGLAWEDTLEDLTLTTDADPNQIGEYAVSVSGGTLSNADCYEVRYVPGALTVLPPKAEAAAAPVCTGGATSLALNTASLPAELEEAGRCQVLAARFEDGAMRRVVAGVYENGVLSFAADLTAQTGWRVFFLDRDVSPLCELLALD